MMPSPKNLRTLKAPKATKSKKTIHSFAAQVSVADIRTETYQGREYLVAPVVALVEGVLQGVNSPVPELALAAEFGKYPQGWNGRPVVMNHPVVGGQHVSAGNPIVLEDWAFGQMFNTTLDDKKLKTEAWIDIALATQKGGEFASTLKRLQDAQMVEISVGCFVSTYSAKGLYGQRVYEAIWTDVVPDHLALLSEGVLGACSIEAGCGAPRINRNNPMTVKPAAVTPKANCSCGGEHTEPTVIANENADADELVEALTAEQASLLSFNRHVGNSLAEGMRAESIPENFFTDDVRSMLSKAVRKTYSTGGESAWLMGFTTNLAVYELYMSGKGYCMYQIAYSMDAQGVVTFSGEPQEVSLITQIMPVNNEQGKDDPMTTPKTQTAEEIAAAALAANAGKTAPKPANAPAAPTPAVEPEPVTPAPATPPAVSPVPPPTNASAKDQPAEPKKPVTVADYVAGAPDEVKEVLNEGIRLQAEKRAKLMKTLKDAGERCTFSEDELKTMSTSQLEKLVKLADVPDYTGAGGRTQGEPVINVNADGSLQGFASAPVEPLFKVGEPLEQVKH